MPDRFFGNLQAHYDIEVEKIRLGDSLEHEIEPRGDIVDHTSA